MADIPMRLIINVYSPDIEPQRALGYVLRVVADGDISVTRGIAHPCAVSQFKADDATVYVYCTPNHARSLRFDVTAGRNG